MNKIPVIAFSAWSGTGKTTIIEKIIKDLKQRGLKVAAVKHDAHDFDIDIKGKDSWRLSNAGADVTVIASAEKNAIIENKPETLPEILFKIKDVDIILAEGYNNDGLPMIGMSRRETKKGFRLDPKNYIALITDEKINTDIPVFDFNDISQITDFIIKFSNTGNMSAAQIQS